MRLHERRANRQAKPRSAKASRGRSVRLTERLEDGGVLARRNADAGIADGDVQAHAIAEPLFAAHLHQNVPPVP
jgi:hypothetical protein